MSNKHETGLVLSDEVETEIVGETEFALPPLPARDRKKIQRERPVQSAADAASSILGELINKSPAFAKYLKKRALATAPVLQKIPLTKARDWVLSFSSETVAPGAIINVSSRPGVLFRGEKIITQADSDGMNDLFITGIFVGQKSQFGPIGSLPFAAFAASALGSGLKLDTCLPALDITFQVQNTGSVAHKFSISLFGKALI